MFIAAMIDNCYLNESDRISPFYLVDGSIAVYRSQVLHHIFLRHCSYLFHVAPEVGTGIPQNTPLCTWRKPVKRLN
jgi:hypothetical protein